MIRMDATARGNRIARLPTGRRAVRASVRRDRGERAQASVGPRARRRRSVERVGRGGAIRPGLTVRMGAGAPSGAGWRPGEGP